MLVVGAPSSYDVPRTSYVLVVGATSSYDVPRTSYAVVVGAPSSYDVPQRRRELSPQLTVIDRVSRVGPKPSPPDGSSVIATNV